MFPGLTSGQTSLKIPSGRPERPEFTCPGSIHQWTTLHMVIRRITVNALGPHLPAIQQWKLLGDDTAVALSTVFLTPIPVASFDDFHH